MERIVIAGGGLAAARACEQLRAKGFDGTITLVGAERHPPYDRPPLTKAALLEDRDTTLRADFEQLAVDLRLGVRATGLDADRRVVHTTGGPVGYDALVVATGARPVRLPGSGRQYTVRTRDDAAVLRARLRPGARLVLVGASWISAEVATAALRLGCSVTCVESSPVPLGPALGLEVGKQLMPWWSDVDLRLETSVVEVTSSGLQLTDGTHLDADVVVSGIGVRPEVEWLHDAGVEIDHGILVDEHLQTSQPEVYAVGDVAARWSPRWHARLRVEHWDDARTAPTTLAGVILGEAPLPIHDPVPYFWSDQFAHKLQYVGHHGPEDIVSLRSDGETWSAAWLQPDGSLTAHLSVDNPRLMIKARAAIDEGKAF
jgi:NADPH-dependent 2,4-dienoyl-CoA reductase/sulfur reductase-like enzyme